MATVLIALFGLSCNAPQENSAATTSPEPTTKNYVALTQRVRQLGALYLAAEEMQAEDQEQYGEFHIIFCGKDVGQLTDLELITPYLERIHNAGGKLFACGFSLTQFGVDATDLAPGIEVVENGITYSLQMKKAGAYSVDQ